MSKHLKAFDLFILADGTIRFIWDDSLKPLLEVGNCVLSRASHVDPKLKGDKVEWFADMKPCGHDIELGPFATRDEALQQEVAYLVKHVLPHHIEKPKGMKVGTQKNSQHARETAKTHQPHRAT